MVLWLRCWCLVLWQCVVAMLVVCVCDCCVGVIVWWLCGVDSVVVVCCDVSVDVCVCVV